jgi:hypothetical protein
MSLLGIILILLILGAFGGGFYGYGAWGPHYGYGGGLLGIILLLVLLKVLGFL